MNVGDDTEKVKGFTTFLRLGYTSHMRADNDRHSNHCTHPISLQLRPTTIFLSLYLYGENDLQRSAVLHRHHGRTAKGRLETLGQDLFQRSAKLFFLI